MSDAPLARLLRPSAVTFSRTLRALSADHGRRGLVSWLLGGLLLGVWGLWLGLGEVELQAVTSLARLESLPHPLGVVVSGRVVESHLEMGRTVEKDALLVQLDARVEQHRLEEVNARLKALEPQLGPLRRELAAETSRQQENRGASQASLEEARARVREARPALALAQEEVKRLETLSRGRFVADIELERARSLLKQREEALSALEQDVSRLGYALRSGVNEGLTRLEQLEREVARLEGEQAALQASAAQLEQEVALRQVRAPVAGTLGEVAVLQPGTFVAEGALLGTVLPRGQLQVVAGFSPSQALGRVRKGQKGVLKLEGFPWTQFGTLPVEVARVAQEVREGQVRVELRLVSPEKSRIPLQHGLPGSLEVAVEKISPGLLLLRTAGGLLDGLGSATAQEDAQK